MQCASPHKHTIKNSNSFLWNDDGRNVKCEYDSEIEDECECECVCAEAEVKIAIRFENFLCDI